MKQKIHIGFLSFCLFSARHRTRKIQTILKNRRNSEQIIYPTKSNNKNLSKRKQQRYHRAKKEEQKILSRRATHTLPLYFFFFVLYLYLQYQFCEWKSMTSLKYYIIWTLSYEWHQWRHQCMIYNSL